MHKNFKWLTPVAIIVAILLLSAVSYYATLNDICAVNDYYIIMRDGGGYKLLLTEYGRQLDHLYSPEVVCYSVTEMKTRLLTGDFTEEEASVFKHFYPAGGLYKCCIDFDELYDAVLPEGVLSNHIVWSGGDYYYIYFTHVFGTSADYIKRMDNSSFRHYREYVNESFYEDDTNGHTTYLRQVQVSDRNATAHYFSKELTAGTTGYVDLWYELSSGNKTLYVQECFKADVYNANGAPYEINILGKQGEYYYKLRFVDLKSRPTEDWLLSFGLKPYVT